MIDKNLTIQNGAYIFTQQNPILLWIYRYHDNHWVGTRVGEIMQALAVITVSTSDPELCIPYAVMHGFRPVLSAQGNKVLQASFHPPHKEYKREPHAGQN